MRLLETNKNIPELFPYKIKRRDGFYFRDHPKGLHPDSPKFKRYWKNFLKSVIEGIWINDEGTWVYMMPKLFFYVNYPLIANADRDDIHPDLRDNEWIIFTYFLCMEGFSGFELDDRYTCHELVGKYEKSQDPALTEKKRKSYELNFIELKKIPESAKKEDGTYKKYIEPWYYLTRHYLIDEPTKEPLGNALYENSKYNGCILSSRGVGKEQPHSEPVLTPSGWKTMGDIQVEDEVIGQDGNPVRVIGKFPQGLKDVYQITLRDGRSIRCGIEHLWKVWDQYAARVDGKRGNWVIKSTKDILDNYYNERVDSKHKAKYGDEKKINEYRYALPINEPIEFGYKNLPIDPYLLGLWLGDGSNHRVDVTSEDVEIVNYYYNIAEQFDLKVSVNSNPSKTCPTYHLTKGNGYKINRPLFQAFKELDLFNSKHIPEIYLTASVEQRLELLRGLMDTDGTCSGRCVEFYNKNKRLAEDTLSLARSLGIYSQLKVKDSKLNGVSYGESYRVTMKTDLKIFNLDRKHQCHLESQPKSKSGSSRFEKVFITDIRKLDYQEESSCILVDSEDHTYITTDYAVTHNSFTTFVGDFLHELLTGGIKRVSELGAVNKRLLFGMGSAMKPQLQRSINNVKYAYYNMPGQYKFRDPDKSMYMGPLFKKLQGSWEVGSELNHIVKAKSRSVDTQGSSIQMVALTKDRTTIGAGDRFRRIYVEEFGFLSNAIDVHGSNKDSLQSMGVRVGSAVYLGTGGDMDAIRQPKEIFQNPEGYDIFGIPNYWSNPNKKCGLFIPKIYGLLDYKDDQGNTYIDLAYNATIEERKEIKDKKDSISYELEIMFNPLVPEEMLRPGNSTILPKQEAQDQLNTLETYDIFRRRAQIGRLVWNPVEERGVEWKKDLLGNLKPILETRIDDTTTFTNKEGAVIIYEQPPEYIPPELYWVIYDPAAKSGDGESFHSVIVYKHFYVGSERTYYDTVVAEWIGRKERLDDNYEMVIKLAKYFNARIFPEINVAGFVEWCRKGNYGHMLEGDAYNLEQEIHGNSAIKRSYYKVGFQMNKRKKNWALKKLRDWLLEVKEVDALSGAPIVRTMDWILSPRILNEIIEYTDDPNENFDHVSSLLGLMLLIGKLDGKPPVDIDEDPEDRHKSSLIPAINYDVSRKPVNGRCKFLKY